MKSSDQTSSVKEDLDEATGAITTPVYMTTAFAFPKGEKYRYSREANPTIDELNKKVAELEGAPTAVSFSSGMGAISTVSLSLLKPGSRVLVHGDMFARTLNFFRGFLARFGVNVVVSEPGTPSFLERLESEKYDLAFFESVSNPLLRVMDVREICSAAADRGTLTVVDATFATPINQRPLEYGASVSLHSASKYIAGHNDVIAGVAAGRSDIMDEVDQLRRSLGTSLDPHAAYMVIRGMKTLKLRMDAVNSNALSVARFLEAHPKVKRVYYPGLSSHVDHDIARKVLKGFGGVVSFEVEGGQKEALDVASRLRLIVTAQTLGGVNSVISHPASMTHRSLSREERVRLGISDRLLRLSVGIEGAEDLIADLDQALSSI
ncbi:MAG: PLP-dependent transferase [Candidatus Marsarchaeota archaeon]